MIKSFTADSLRVNIYASRGEMGRAAAADISSALRAVLSEKETCHVVFAAAPSQNEVLSALAEEPSIDWSRIIAYHMDEYVGLPADATQAFGNFLRRALFSRVPLRAVHYLAEAGPDADTICISYSRLLRENPADIVCLGIGENGHIAFNDPHVADFYDPLLVKKVALDPICRMQQVNDGCFSSIEEVPTHALTLTIPALTQAEKLFCVVPASTKAKAVRRTIHGGISEACPATVLRSHPGSILYLDPDSAALLPIE